MFKTYISIALLIIMSFKTSYSQDMEVRHLFSKFAAAYRQHDTTYVAKNLHPDFTLSDHNETFKLDSKAFLNSLAWESIMNGYYHFYNIKYDKDTVHCLLKEYNDFYCFLDLPVQKFRMTFVFKHKLLLSQKFTAVSDSQDSFDSETRKRLQPVIKWCESNLHSRFDALFYNNNLVIDRPAAELWQEIFQLYPRN